MNTLPLKIREELDGYFTQNRLSEEKKRDILNTVKILYAKSSYDPEEPVGVVTAQSLSEPATQMTMRTYHFAGTAGIQVTLGLPRMLEIFDARREPRTPTMTVYMKKDHQNIEDVRKIASSLREVKAKDVILSTTTDLTEVQIRCKLDTKKLASLGMDPQKVSKCVRLRNTETLVEGDELIVRPKKVDLKNLHKLKYSLLESHVKGIRGISQVVVTKEEGEWIITTLGSNLKKVFEIEGVDYTRIVSNNIFEVLNVLGTEAARNVIIKQAKYTLEEQGLGVDVRYIMLLADLMTVEGHIRAIGRYGLSGQKASVLVRASFEETKKHLTSAAIRGEKDDLRGTVENIMMNQVAPIGTGAFTLVRRLPGLAGKKEWREKPRRTAKPKKPKKTKKPAKIKKTRKPKKTRERKAKKPRKKKK
ncbi:MAG: DNA-directed RNA polymerase subunit A'' [Candidatus Aenigmatarchaeota archaeon]|nr:MAG: DNA-directed RNA polymerase subunit A'' [Candidatus Aenigmarchaeota archaeon]